MMSRFRAAGAGRPQGDRALEGRARQRRPEGGGDPEFPAIGAARSGASRAARFVPARSTTASSATRGYFPLPALSGSTASRAERRSDPGLRRPLSGSDPFRNPSGRLGPAIILASPAGAEDKIRAVAGDKYSYHELDEYSDLIARTLIGGAQASKYQRNGVLPEQIFLDYFQERLASYGDPAHPAGRPSCRRTTSRPEAERSRRGEN